MLLSYLPQQTYAIAAGYINDEIIAVVAGALINEDNSIRLVFPKGNPFKAGQKITLHLDNRTGAEAFSAELRVYRCSYKGIMAKAEKDACLVTPLEYDLRFSDKSAEFFKGPGYEYPEDRRNEEIMEKAKLKEALITNDTEERNKLGVWITKAADQPHTTVMAFLSSSKDDIFVISHRDSFKSNLIHRDENCCFAIDHRANYVFEKAYDWNYTIITGKVREIPQGSDFFADIQHMFVEKNPWEFAFFTAPNMELFCLSPEKIIVPDTVT
jgi:nitroimidazol reductase NimA-like FMN-containing flavoprotein (pyridoxamine 5'-phosphate oxidase superfamily)